MCITNLLKIIQLFETTGTLVWQPGQERKVTSQQQVEEAATAIVEQEMKNERGTSSARAVSRHTHIPYSTVRKILYQMLQFYPYKISSVQESLAPRRCDHPIGFFIDILSTHASWYYMAVAFYGVIKCSFIWTLALTLTTAAFRLRIIRTLVCKNLSTRKKSQYGVALQHPLPSVLTFIRKMEQVDQWHCTVTAARYADMLQTFTIPQLQQRGCLDSTISQH